MIRRPPRSTLFPFPTLSRSAGLSAFAEEYRDTAAAHRRQLAALRYARVLVERELDAGWSSDRSEEHTSELQSRQYLVCRLLLEKKTSPAISMATDVEIGQQV